MTDQLFFVNNFSCRGWREDGGRGVAHDCLCFVAYRHWPDQRERAAFQLDPTLGPYHGWTAEHMYADEEWVKQCLGWLRTHPLKAIKAMGCTYEEPWRHNEWLMLDLYIHQHPEVTPLPVDAEQLALL